MNGLNLFSDRRSVSGPLSISVIYYQVRESTTSLLSVGWNERKEFKVHDDNSEETPSRSESNNSVMNTILFRAIIFFLVIIIIYIIMRLLYHRQNLKYSWKLEKMEKEKIEEINEAKIRFFTDLSHDLKTPLTLIQGPIEKLFKSETPDLKEVEKLLPLIYRNSKRLTILIEELLTFRKLNDGKLKLSASYQDLIFFVKAILAYYEDAAFEKKIEVIEDYQFTGMKGWFDPFKMEQILHNLISNGLKYGSENGTLKISLSAFKAPPENRTDNKKEIEWIRLTIFNETTPIPQEHLDHIFDRFYKVDKKSSGTGIGLSVVKSLVELHHGHISVRSSEEIGGVSFEILIPREDVFLEPHEKASVNKYVPIKNLPDRSEIHEKTPVTKNDAKKRKTFSILLVEDNKDLRDFLYNSLSAQYKVKTANNGAKGLELAKNLIPDIIISDVVMPVMDGFELAGHIKENTPTSHIPVILLTARTSDSDKIAGYRSGADAYVEKPFNLDVLLEQIKRVIRNREIMQKNFKEWVNKKDKPEDISYEDHSFINLINKHIEANMSKGEISVNDIAESVGLSTTQVYRKVKALTNYTPIEYIRFYKLSRAQELLPHHKYSIKEIAYMSGFNDPSYFGKCFKNEFGISPQAYRNNYVEYKL